MVPNTLSPFPAIDRIIERLRRTLGARFGNAQSNGSKLGLVIAAQALCPRDSSKFKPQIFPHQTWKEGSRPLRSGVISVKSFPPF